MSVFTATTFLFLLIFSPLSLASALPCPECEEGYPPPVVIITEPCDECEQHPHTPPPVIVTEPCHECEEHHPTPHVLTETISVCRRTSPTKSITPFTSGSHTYLISSCIPSTMWFTHNETAAPITSISTTTSISIRTMFPNNTQVGPVQTAYPNASTIYITKPGSAPVQIETLISTSYAPPVTYTSYASGSPPATVTFVTTQVQSFTTTRVETTQHVQNRLITVTLPPSTQRVTSTQRIISTQRITETSYASGKPPATVTVVTTHVERVRVPTRITMTLSPSTQRITTTQRFTSTVLRTHVTTKTVITSAPAGTIVQTEEITHTRQLPAHTSYATVTKGTQIITKTLSVATKTLISTPKAVTHTSVLPASTHIITTTQRAQVKTITKIATAESDVFITSTGRLFCLRSHGRG